MASSTISLSLANFSCFCLSSFFLKKSALALRLACSALSASAFFRSSSAFSALSLCLRMFQYFRRSSSLLCRAGPAAGAWDDAFALHFGLDFLSTFLTAWCTISPTNSRTGRYMGDRL